MKKNKKVSQWVGIIIMLVLASGVVYYLEINKYKAEERKNTEIINSLTSKPSPTPVASPVTVKPTVTVISPNGGQVLKINETQLITWKTTGLKNTNTVGIGLRGSDGVPCWIGTVNASLGQMPYVPASVYCEFNKSGLKVGETYKVNIGVTQYDHSIGVVDESDSSFTFVR